MAIVDTQGEALSALLQDVTPQDLRELSSDSVLILPTYGRVDITGIRNNQQRKCSTICLMNEPILTSACDEPIDRGYLVFLRKANEEEIIAFCGPEGARSRSLATFVLLRIIHSGGNVITLMETDKKKTFVELV